MTAKNLLAIAVVATLGWGCADPSIAEDAAAAAETPTETVVPAASTRQVRLIADEYRFEPNEIVARPGERLRVTIDNKDNRDYRIKFELPDGAVEMPDPVRPNGSGSIDITAPNEKGEYDFASPVGNHESMGMTGRLIVR